MKRKYSSFKCFVVFSVLIIGFASLSMAVLAEENKKDFTPSRPAEKDCSWELVKSSDDKLSVVVQKCDFGFRKISHSISDSALQERFSDSPEADKIIQFFDNQAGDTPTKILAQLFISKLSEYEQKHCVVKQTKSKYILQSPFKDASKSAWIIEPDKEYSAKIKRETPKGDMPADSCGEYGSPVDSRAYFEFHSNSPHKFAWVIVGQDTPLFDEQSIQF